MNIHYFENNKNSELYFQNRSEIKNFLKSEQVKNINIVLKFSASWCGPCNYSTLELRKALTQIQLNNDNDNDTYGLNNKKEIIILDIDVDKYDDIASYFKIRSLPTVISYFNGDPELVHNSMSENEWSKLLNSLH